MLKPFTAVPFTVLSFFVLLGCGNHREAKEPLSTANNVEKEAKAQDRRIAIDVGLVVSNLEESLTFYHDLLGLPIIARIDTKLIGKGRMVQLRHGASLIKIVEFEEAPTIASPREISSSYGLRYITFMVDNLDDVVSKMEKNQIFEVLPVTELSTGTRIYMVEDPDGNVVEFVQEPVN